MMLNENLFSNYTKQNLVHTARNLSYRLHLIDFM